MNDATIVAEQLTVQKAGRPILDEVTLSVKKGAITGLIGPSGSGKTTLMRTIIGAQQPSMGEVRVLGLVAGSQPLRRKVGYVTQTPAVYGDLTVRQNLGYFASLVEATRQDVDIILDMVRLAPQANQLVGSLSGGQRARVSLAVALLGKPEVLVLDEPTVGLDPLLRSELWDMFADLARSGVTLLVSSHVMDEADRCDELILLRDGKVLWHDSRQALLDATQATDVGRAFITIIQREEIR